MNNAPPTVEDDCARDRLSADPVAYLAACRREHGDVFTLPLSTPVTYVLDAGTHRAVLTSRAVDFAPISRQSKIRFGLGALVETDEDVRALSHVFIRALRGATLVETLERFDAALRLYTEAFARTLSAEREMALDALVDATLVPASVAALFGEQAVDAHLACDVRNYSVAVAARLTGASPKLKSAGLAASDALGERFARCIEGEQAPLVRALLRDGADTATRDTQVAMVRMLMWGSLVNLSPTASWMAASVFREPALQDELARAEDGEGMTLAGSVVLETLRLYSRPNMYRAVRESFDLTLRDGERVRLEAGSWVALFPRFAHLDGEAFQAPESFVPTRFVDADEPGRLRGPGASMLVFGMGKGRCPGDRYATEVLERTLLTWTRSLRGALVKEELPPPVKQTVASTPAPCQPILTRIQCR